MTAATSPSKPALPGPWHVRVGVVLAALAIMGALAPIDRRAILVNTTPSEPLGLYVRKSGLPGPGQLVSFPAPAAAFPYADRRLAYLHRVPLLKAIIAGPGDRVCTLGDHLVVNGRTLGAIIDLDREGRPLPHWRDCRALRADELFAYSDRVPNSFDSRYFGPVPKASVIGVFQPLLIARETH